MSDFFWFSDADNGRRIGHAFADGYARHGALFDDRPGKLSGIVHASEELAERWADWDAAGLRTEEDALQPLSSTAAADVADIW